MAPPLFSMAISTMLTDVFQDCVACFPSIYRFDGKLLNLRRMQAKCQVQLDVLDKLLHADECQKHRKNARGYAWIECHKHETILTLQSTIKRLK